MNARWILRAIAAVSALGWAATAQAVTASAQRDASATPLPPICFQDIGHRTRCLGNFRGQVVVLNLWATFCTPCIRELPMLDALHRRLRGQGVTVLAVAVDRRGAGAVQAMRERLGIAALDFYLDAQGRSLSAIGARGIPQTLLIDPAGIVRQRWAGAIGGRETELVRHALSLTNDPPRDGDTDMETAR